MTGVTCLVAGHWQWSQKNLRRAGGKCIAIEVRTWPVYGYARAPLSLQSRGEEHIMTRLNQIVALEAPAKAEAARALETAKAKAKLDTQMAGISRTYTPRQEDGDMFPPESTRVQVSVADIIGDLRPQLARWLDLFATKEETNTQAAADVVVDGQVIAEAVPVPVLLAMERQLADLKALAQMLPVLDPAERWDPEEPGIYRTRERQTAKTLKVPKAFVKYEATKEHPAQVEAYTEDVVIGDWAVVKFSGAMRARDKAALLERIRVLTAAVLSAREEANSIDVIDLKPGQAVMEFVFG